MTVQLITWDALTALATLPAGSVQTCVTSPPYYGSRQYLAEGEAGKEYEIGLEASPEQYVARLVEVFREVRRVLRDDGTLWLNIGDSYWGGKGENGSSKARATAEERGYTQSAGTVQMSKRPTDGRHETIKPKDLIGIPWMLAFALRADGWWLRSEIIWHKPNPMPESVTDRPTKAHEQIFLLAKSAQYFFDAEAISESASEKSMERGRYSGGKIYTDKINNSPDDLVKPDFTRGEEHYWPATRNKRSVWTVTTKPYAEAHFATFPPDLIEPCVLAGTSQRGECPTCGKAWVRVVEQGELVRDDGSPLKLVNPIKRDDSLSAWTRPGGKVETVVPNAHYEKTTTGWQPQCECGGEPVPQVVLDPFNGSGTTGAVAVKHHRDYVGIELNPAYIRLTERRLRRVQPVLI